MSAGELKHKATLYSPSIVSDGQGGQTTSYVSAGSLYLGFIDNSSAIDSIANSANDTKTRKAKARYNALLVIGARLTINNTNFNIKSVKLENDRPQYMILDLEAQ